MSGWIIMTRAQYAKQFFRMLQHMCYMNNQDTMDSSMLDKYNPDNPWMLANSPVIYQTCSVSNTPDRTIDILVFLSELK